jgi:2,3-bisphosphoglycerate-independent phosphoglycerate mutase
MTVPTTYVLVLCGAADRPTAALDGATPLEAARTPALDRLASRGRQGVMTVIGGGISPESDSGIMALLGYDPLIYYRGRGALEAFGMGFLSPGDNAVAFRINLASFDSATDRLDRRTARDVADDELQRLIEAVRSAAVLEDHGIELSIAGFGRHRGVLCLQSAVHELSANVTNTDPGFRRDGWFGVPVDDPEPRPLRCSPLDDTSASVTTAAAVNALVDRVATILDRHPVNHARRKAGRLPANCLLLRDAGTVVPDLTPFAARFARTLAIHGQIPAERGLCLLLGGAWRSARQPENCGDEAYYAALVAALVRDREEVVLVHVKGPDEPAHDRRPAAKIHAIEQVDRLLVGPLVAALSDQSTIAVTCDHATPWEAGIHVPDPVPALVARPGPEGAGSPFGERWARAGNLPVGRAHELLDWLFDGDLT